MRTHSGHGHVEAWGGLGISYGHIRPVKDDVTDGHGHIGDGSSGGIGHLDGGT